MPRAALALVAAAAALAVPLALSGEAAACHPANDLLGWKFFKDVNTKLTWDRCVPFQHSGWAGEEPTYLETLGAGVCAGDVNGDGKVDLYATNGVDPGQAAPNALFRNTGDGSDPHRFANVTATAGVGRVGWSTGCAFADYDNDGDQDLYVAGHGSGALYRNKGAGTFDDVTAAAGVANDQCGLGQLPCWGSSPAWLDYDRDGDLDLYVANYLDLTDPTGSLDPALYHGQPNALFRNDGPDADGAWRFTEVAEAAGVQFNDSPHGGRSLGVAVADFDADGWPDLLVANDEDHAALYRNNADGTFGNVARQRGLDDARANMGVDWADVGHDGTLDAVLTHWTDEHPGLWRYDGSAFSDQAAALGLVAGSVGWGANFFDLENDGDWDLWIANGHPNADLENAAQPGQLYQWDGSAFRLLDNEAGEDDPGDAGPAVARTGRGAAFVDVDNDGDVDIVGANNRGNLSLLRNNVRGDGNASSPYGGNHYLQLRLRGVTSPCEPWGAKVSLTAGGRTMTRALGSGGSYQSGNDARLHFGLGSATSAEVAITWPSGAVETRALGANDIDRVRELKEAFDALPPAPGAPEVAVNPDASIGLRWRPVGACDVRSYEVHVGSLADFAPGEATLQATFQGRDRGIASLSGLPDNTRLHARIVAVDAVGQRTPGPSTPFTTPNLPPPPVVLQPPVVQGPHAVQLAWTPPAIADFARYEVHGAVGSLAAANATTRLRNLTGDPGASSAVIEGLLDNTTYAFRVLVVDTAGDAAASDAVTAALPDAPPPTPVLEVPEAGRGALAITVAWPAAALPHDFARGELFASRQAGFAPEAGDRVASFKDRRTEQAVGGLVPGTTYHFRLRIVDRGGLAALSPEATAATLPVDLPAARLSVAGTGPDWAALAWDAAPAEGFRAYEVHVSATPGFTPANATRILVLGSVGTTAYNLTGLAPGAAHHFRLVVVTAFGAVASNEVAVRTPERPAAPAAAEPLARTSLAPSSSPGAAGAGPLLVGLRAIPAPGAFDLVLTADRPARVVVFLDGAEAARRDELREEHAIHLGGLGSEQAVRIAVVATDASGAGARAEAAAATLALPPLAAPRGLVASVAPGGGGVLLQWQGPESLRGVAHVRVYRAVSQDGLAYGPFVLVAEVDPRVQSLRDDAPPAAWVEYRVVSVDPEGRESRAGADSREFLQLSTTNVAAPAPVPGVEAWLGLAALGAAAAAARRRR